MHSSVAALNHSLSTRCSQHMLHPLQVLKQRVEFMPSFEKAVDHICIHTGGRAVLEGLQAQLGLSDHAMEPSKAALWRYGNTSSASIWCERAGPLICRIECDACLCSRRFAAPPHAGLM